MYGFTYCSDKQSISLIKITGYTFPIISARESMATKEFRCNIKATPFIFSWRKRGTKGVKDTIRDIFNFFKMSMQNRGSQSLLLFYITGGLLLLYMFLLITAKTSGWTSGECHLICLPINFRIMPKQPSMSNDGWFIP